MGKEIKVCSEGFDEQTMPFPLLINAAINGYLELTLLKGRQWYDAISTLNLEVYEFWDRWIFQFIFEHIESLPSNISSMVNLEWMGILLFYYFVYLKVNLDLEKNKSA